MNIKHFFPSALLLLSGATVTAQTHETSVWEDFGSNLYIDAGGGVQTLFAPGWKDIAFGKQITPSFSLGVGKWFNPFWGIHFAAEGYSFNGFRPGGSYDPFSPLNRVDVGYDGSFRYYLRYMGLNADIRFSLLNLIAGREREEALYDLVPYIGIGYAHMFAYRGSTKENLFTGHAGVRNRFAVHRMVDVNLDVTAGWTDNYVNPVTDRYMASMAVQVGVSFYPGRRAFRKPTMKVPVETFHYRTDTVFVREVPGRDKVIEFVPDHRNILGVVMASVRFAVNRSMAYEGQETQIYEVARYLREHPKAVVRIEGYADATSGSEDYNHKLAQQRAEYVRKQLVDTYKADASRIETKAIGTARQPYDDTTDTQWNCVAIIRLIK
ncbi:OmpA family protein [Paraprevotella clara]|jgi:major outer membrane protein ompA|uniref:OmpA family protein n=1 Tax=Paraprevotella clara TaxID=454154 RepID=UPI0026757785|nr:OmpA family protein [Paraprevotella clara]